VRINVVIFNFVFWGHAPAPRSLYHCEAVRCTDTLTYIGCDASALLHPVEVQTSVHTTAAAAAAEDDDVIADHPERLLLSSMGSKSTCTKFVYCR